MRAMLYLLASALAVACMIFVGTSHATETLQGLMSRVEAERQKAYEACLFSALSRDFFSRFSRDPNARPESHEVLIESNWKIAVLQDTSPLGRRMAKDLAEFLARAMAVTLDQVVLPGVTLETAGAQTILLTEQDGGDPQVPESFTVTVGKDHIGVAGTDPAGLRDGVIHLIDSMGFRQAPILVLGTQTYTPRLTVRIGRVPRMGTVRDVAFFGYNGVIVASWKIRGSGTGSLYALSTSNAIAELAARRKPDVLKQVQRSARQAGKYGLKAYAFIDTTERFSKSDPIFQTYPGIRGASRRGEDVLCTEDPRVRQFLTESMAGLFRDVPGLAGVVIIIGGEGFYHCFMNTDRSCARCGKLGAETVVANLCNALGAAVREVNPAAEVIAWPYSATGWSADDDQAQLIAKLKPGTAILTGVEKDESVKKPGFDKRLWDYSIDLVELGGRATRQYAACEKAGIPLYLKSDPEFAFEGPALPHVPCLDRWLGRAEALAASGAKGTFLLTYFRPGFGTSAMELLKRVCWNPVPKQEDVLQQLAARIAGPEGGPHLRNAWRAVSEAISFSPELPPYFTGPYYLGPAHPMCADPAARLPELFKARFLFLGELSEADGMALQSVCLTSPRGDVPVFGKMYRQMEACLKRAADDVKAAERLVPQRCRVPFGAEASCIRWFYATVRTHANFYEACQLRDRFRTLSQADPTGRDQLKMVYDRWLEILRDERQNLAEALPIAEADMRLDFYYATDVSFSHVAGMIRAKSKILDREINQYLPSLARQARLPESGVGR